MISAVCKIPVYGCKMMMRLWPCPKHFELFHRPHCTRKVINQTRYFSCDCIMFPLRQYTGLKIPLIWLSMTTYTVSGPVELTLPLFWLTRSFYEECQALFFLSPYDGDETSLFVWPIPLTITYP